MRGHSIAASFDIERTDEKHNRMPSANHQRGMRSTENRPPPTPVLDVEHCCVEDEPMNKPALISLLGLLCGCSSVGIPANAKAVDGFDVNRYLGTWYEIARLENRFEKGLQKVSATYSLREDGGLKVVNRGYDPQKDRWSEATGKAYFVGAPKEGRLKVSFFGPFYGAYNIIALDEAYGWSLVCGPDYQYLWILSRTPQLPEMTVHQLVEKAKALGFGTDELLFVKQD
jgi:apolipoprotein D and lipocalin family protein